MPSGKHSGKLLGYGMAIQPQDESIHKASHHCVIQACSNVTIGFSPMPVVSSTANPFLLNGSCLAVSRLPDMLAEDTDLPIPSGYPY